MSVEMETENIINELFENDESFKLYNGKYRGNHGIDHLVENLNTGEIWIVSSKKLGKSQKSEAGGIKLIENATARERELSEKWIEEILNQLPTKEKQIVKEAIKNRKIKTAITAVNKKTGNILVLPVAIENKK